MEDHPRLPQRGPDDRPPFIQRTAPLGIRLDVSNVAEVLDALEGAYNR